MAASVARCSMISSNVAASGRSRRASITSSLVDMAFILCTTTQFLRDHRVYHLPLHIGQAEVAATVAIRQPFVVEAHEVQDGGVQVVDADALVHGAMADLVGGAVAGAALRAASRHPDG